MRDIIVTLIVLGSIPYIIKKPYIGVLMWSWVGYMSPHRLAYGFAYNMPFAALIGAVTIAVIPFAKVDKKIPWNSVSIAWALFLTWMIITTLFSQFPDLAMDQLKKVIKIQLMVLITLVIIKERQQIHQLVWVIVLSLGFYGVKGGFFAAITGGNYMVWGPSGSFIEGNNELAFALVMVVPLMRYLQLHTENKWIKRALSVSMLLMALSILSSYSRGAALGLFCVGFFLALKSNKKLVIALVILISLPIFYQFMPDKWKNRMDTIETYEDDGSAMGRIYVWQVALKTANDYPLGAGFGMFGTRIMHDRYGPEITNGQDLYIATDAHSIYFLVLGEHGYFGLLLFLIMLFVAFRAGSWVVRNTKNREELMWARDLAAMGQVSLIGYMVAGSFVGQSYFDLPYHIISILTILYAYVKKEIAKESEPPVAERDFRGRYAPYK